MGVWQLDPYHTQVEFTAKHLGMMTVRGHFADITSTGHIDPDHPETSSVEVTIQTASIHTHHPARDDDLRSSNFLETSTYPTITFKSTDITPKDADHFTLTGDLTVKATTRPISLEVQRYGEFNDPMMGHRMAYSARGQLNRKDYGLNFNAVLDGKFVVSDEIQISIEVELVEKQEEAAAAS